MQHHPLPFPADALDVERVTEVFKALSDPTRLQLMVLLMRGETKVSTLVDHLQQPQSTVSRHLTLLRTAHLVQTRREATSVYYRLADSHVAELLTQAFSHAQHERLGLPDHAAHDATIGRVH
ncbi:metalloregulator ArsR/SmtB family transcription factor (plasmid) [Deinococcus sp. KNUC1210]|uniref:ArsR/SmtB family transcription factor n=1 Tax=Deinococcus sp. KNUC1210 TaxID=2917691 RepID=UPI001EF13CBF|nr:metalloregulator ArsR/SmtB family transcription factor [Deinococcus sp. KNUC1210]ULH17839.1 metalloregulator ArsR/SmtB family transcription factor [Deinococcus sp. KNUC1210]